MDYKTALLEALQNKELIAQYDRLFSANLGECLLSMCKGGINYQIDLATGRIKAEIKRFDMFYYYYVWLRLPAGSVID